MLNKMSRVAYNLFILRKNKKMLKVIEIYNIYAILLSNYKCILSDNFKDLDSSFKTHRCTFAIGKSLLFGLIL